MLLFTSLWVLFHQNCFEVLLLQVTYFFGYETIWRLDNETEVHMQAYEAWYHGKEAFKACFGVHILIYQVLKTDFKQIMRVKENTLLFWFSVIDGKMFIQQQNYYHKMMLKNHWIFFKQTSLFAKINAWGSRERDIQGDNLQSERRMFHTENVVLSREKSGTEMSRQTNCRRIILLILLQQLLVNLWQSFKHHNRNDSDWLKCMVLSCVFVSRLLWLQRWLWWTRSSSLKLPIHYCRITNHDIPSSALTQMLDVVWNKITTPTIFIISIMAIISKNLRVAS